MAQKLDLNRLLPSSLKNETLTSLVANLFNRFLSNEESVFVAGEVGAKDGFTSTPEIQAPDLERELNALVPALYTKVGTEERVAVWEDALNRLRALGCDINGLHGSLAEQHFNFVPPISLDKFVNYSNYYWVGGQLGRRAISPWNPRALPEYYVIAPPPKASPVKLSVDWAVEAGRTLALWGADRPGTVNPDGTLDGETFRLTFTSSSTFVLSGSSDNWNPAQSRASFIVWDRNPLDPSQLGNGQLDQVDDVSYPAGGSVPFDPSVGAQRRFFIAEPDSAGDADGNPEPLVQFTLITGSTPFAPGDWIEINIIHLTSTIKLTASPSIAAPGSGKGHVTNVSSIAGRTFIDQAVAGGIRAQEGERVLAWQQANPAENGIYVFRNTRWVRAEDADTAAKLPLGAQVYVRNGATNAGHLFQVTVAPTTLGVDPIQFTDLGAIDENDRPTNDWQEYNFWLHRDEVLANKFLSLDAAVQAKRPIIELDARVQLNKYVDADGAPTEVNTGLISGNFRKTRFNQVPLLDLFRYDGTHAKKVSSVFFYEEDPDFPVDPHLQRRVKTTKDADFIFGVGIKDEQGRLLFFKLAGELKTVWAPGAAAPEVGAIRFTGGPGRGTLTVVPAATADPQAWTLTATSATTFTVVGSRSGNVTEAAPLQVGVPLTVPGEVTLTVTAGANPFLPGETFTFNVRNRLAPRYAKKLPDGTVVNYPGGPIADQQDDGVVQGLWLTPRRMFQNLRRELLTSLNFADLATHLRSIIRAQDGFEGTSFGPNNYHRLTPNLGAGGRIREFDSNFPLLLSMLTQPSTSPLGLLDFAEQQYRVASASVERFVADNLGQYLHEVDSIPLAAISPTHPKLQRFLRFYEAQRAADVNLRATYGDSTALVPNWPITAPIMGLVRPELPRVEFDHELSLNVIVYHDGHRLPLLADNHQFNRQLVQRAWPRSDGALVPGILDGAMPLPPATQPYARQLWLNTSTQRLYIFDVVADTDEAPAAGAAGDFWYKRSANELYAWDAGSGSWVLDTATPIATLWRELSPAAIQNSLTLAVERRLYESVHPARAALPLSYDVLAQAALPASTVNLEIELARFAMKHGYDTYAPSFDATDAFSWNYSQATIPFVPAGTARWHVIYREYFGNFDPPNVLPTTRPDLEPWRLLGYPTKADADAALAPSTWDGLYSGLPARRWSNQMWADIQAARPGLKLCVNVNTDELLPPYVSPSDALNAPNALLNVIPPGIEAGYKFGDEGPVELVWRKSLEFVYGAARVSFKADPLRFLDQAWGETYVRAAAGELRLERNLVNSLPHTRFQLHGERLHHVVQRNVGEHLTYAALSWTGAATLELVVTFVADDRTFFDVLVDGAPVGVIEEGGPPLSLVQPRFSITNLKVDDLGIPFCLGDKFTITFHDDAPPPAPAGGAPTSCEGCVAPGAEPPPPPGTPVPPTFAFTPGTVKRLIGLGQIFTNLLRYNSVDTAVSEAVAAFRGWELKLAHRFGALIRPDTLTVKTSLGQLPTTAYRVLLKRGEGVSGAWITGLRVQLLEMGARTTNEVGNLVPVADGADWVFRIEGYNPLNPVLERYVLDTNGPFETFFALNKRASQLAWRRYTRRLQLVTTPLPLTVVGVQSVINVIYGYIDRLVELGYEVNLTEHVVTDDETGRNLDWQLEVEKFIDRVYSGLSAGTGHILNPFYRVLHRRTPVGLAAPFVEPAYLDSYVRPGLYDVAGEIIPIRSLQVIRTDDGARVHSSTPIYSAHTFNDEYEHALLLNERVSDEAGAAAIFVPFLGQALDRAYLSYRRQLELHRKPTFDGFFLSGSDVRRNIVSSIDQIGHYYDAAHVHREPTTARHALALLGFSPKEYFNKLGVSDATQFNYWRGLIQAKGTNLTIDALVNHAKFERAAVDEYWAYKLATYGDAREREFPELKLSVADAAQRFTQLQFYREADGLDALPLFTPVAAGDDGRWFSIDDLGTNPRFELQAVEETVTASHAGYVRLSNIFHNGDVAAPTVTPATGAQLIGANLLKVTAPGTYVVRGYTWLNPTKFSPLKLIDHVNKVVVTNIPLWHPAIGIHAPEPLQVINIIGPTDPALYNHALRRADNPNFRDARPWAAREVGRVWWDTSNLSYVPYYDATVFPDRQERHAHWGKLAEWASVDLYEWVESTVPPGEYDAKAQVEEGRSDIPVEVRASGRAARKQLYRRERRVRVRPIAWSRAAVGSPVSHPSFGPAFGVRAYDFGQAIYADVGRCEAINLVPGRRFGGWVPGNAALGVEAKPVGEVILLDELVYDIGGAAQPGAPTILPHADVQLALVPLESGAFGRRLGKLRLTTRAITNALLNETTHLARLLDETGFFEDQEIEAWDGPAGERRHYDFANLGVRLIAVKLTPSALTAAQLAAALDGRLADVHVREGIRYATVIPLPDTSASGNAFINDPLDPGYPTSQYEWRTWEVPTQAQLAADLLPPKNAWRPYPGDWQPVNVTSEVIADMGAASANLTLRSGDKANRYEVTWTDWELLTDVRLERVSNGVDQVTFLRDEFVRAGEEIDPNRLRLFVNGIQLSPNPRFGYVIGYDAGQGQPAVQVVNILKEGATVLLIYSPPAPTEAELAFNPEVKDDLQVQVQYKRDYQYTQLEVRDATGRIAGRRYYFWVTDKVTARRDKLMSIKQAAAMLEAGPSPFMLFARAVKEGERVAFDSIAIEGLTRLITKNDTYKLRLTRNFTLRDDPEQLRLKNVHTEWALIRRGQQAKIPRQLWDRLTDAVAGADVGGNPLPSQVRIDYDKKYGTRTRYGFEPGQILADTELLRASVTNTILNTKLVIRAGGVEIPDYIRSLDFSRRDEWFATPEAARATMNLIWETARARQVNEIFFDALEDALAANFELTDIFKTSYITVQSATRARPVTTGELEDAIF